ncbi:MAG: dihydrodipicolinate synthase family protein [Chloroflexota bacterium]
MLDRTPFEGIYSVLVTPFLEDGSLDEEGLDLQVDLQLALKVSGLVLFGLAGEGFKLTEGERERIADRVARRLDGRLPLVAGAEHNGTLAAAHLARRAVANGATAIMSMPPSFLKPSADALVDYYRAIADASGVPVIIQDAPGATGVPMPPPLLARIAREVPGVAAIKVEAPPMASKMAEVLRLTDQRIGVLGGMGGRYYLQELRAGARGTMIGPAFPDCFVQIHAAFRQGDPRAEELFRRYLPLFGFSEGNDAFTHGQKRLLRRAGIIKSAVVRQPTVGIDPRTAEEWDLLVESLRPLIVRL